MPEDGNCHGHCGKNFRFRETHSVLCQADTAYLRIIYENISQVKRVAAFPLCSPPGLNSSTLTLSSTVPKAIFPNCTPHHKPESQKFGGPCLKALIRGHDILRFVQAQTIRWLDMWREGRRTDA